MGFEVGRKYLTKTYQEKAGDNLKGLRKVISDNEAVDSFLKKYEGRSMHKEDVEREMMEYVQEQIDFTFDF